MRFKKALVVGSSGGIGAALATLLSQQGAQVTALSRTIPPNSSHWRTGEIDIEEESSIERAAGEVEEDGPYDLIIVASGVLHDAQLTPEKSHKQLSSAAFQRYFSVNAAGPALVAKHFLPLLSRNAPAIFAALSARVGSISDNRLGGWYGYRASKAALNMIIKTLAIEVARTRPQAVCAALHPGTVDTALSAPFQRAVSSEKLFTPSVCAGHLLDVISNLEPADSGGCFAWDGKRIEP